MSKQLALFDFDGTITRKDTFIEIIRFKFGTGRLLTGMVALSPVLVAYKLKLIKNWRAKEIMFGHFFKGMTESEFQKTGEEFARVALPGLLRPSALRKIEEHRDAGHECYIVTASAADWIKPWSDQYGFKILSTQWEIVEGRISGKIKGRNCYGPEKKTRILERVVLPDYEVISVYGDTSGDREMLTLATHPYYRFFND